MIWNLVGWNYSVYSGIWGVLYIRPYIRGGRTSKWYIHSGLWPPNCTSIEFRLRRNLYGHLTKSFPITRAIALPSGDMFVEIPPLKSPDPVFQGFFSRQLDTVLFWTNPSDRHPDRFSDEAIIIRTPCVWMKADLKVGGYKILTQDSASLGTPERSYDHPNS